MNNSVASPMWSTFEANINNSTVDDLYNNIYLAEYIGVNAVNAVRLFLYNISI